jgi:hypothetical protein
MAPVGRSRRAPANPIWPSLPLLLLFGRLELWSESFDLSLIASSVLIEKRPLVDYLFNSNPT